MTTVEESCMPYSYKPYCFKNNKLSHEIKKNKKKYSFRPNLFVLFEKSNILRKHHLLSCLSYKNV